MDDSQQGKLLVFTCLAQSDKMISAYNVASNALASMGTMNVTTDNFVSAAHLKRNQAEGLSIRQAVVLSKALSEVLSYMRSLCVRTNVYCKVETSVMLDMFETLSTMPDDLKPAATNRVAQYMYFAIHHVTDSQGWQDRELANFIPAYSNSLQRLSLMRYVSTSATNDWERANAAQVVQRLESLPTNQLNDVSWIAE